MKIKTLAIYDARYEAATREVVGDVARLIACPPYMAADIAPFVLRGFDFIYLDLHSVPDSLYLLAGVELDHALSVRAIEAVDLTGAVVFATTCYLPQTPFLQALLDSNAEAVICGDGENLAGESGLAGVNLLALWFRRWFELGLSPENALELAKLRLRLSAQTASVKDALGFKCERAKGQGVRIKEKCP